jgi:hypothetical protein
MHVTTYERVVNGEVVERVTPIDGSHEDTRIGVLVLEGNSEWRLAGSTQPNESSENSAPAQDDDAPPPPADAVPENHDGAVSAPDASVAGPNTSEEPDGEATTDGDGAGTHGNKPSSRRQRG